MRSGEIWQSSSQDRTDQISWAKIIQILFQKETPGYLNRQVSCLKRQINDSLSTLLNQRKQTLQQKLYYLRSSLCKNSVIELLDAKVTKNKQQDLVTIFSQQYKVLFRYKIVDLNERMNGFYLIIPSYINIEFKKAYNNPQAVYFMQFLCKSLQRRSNISKHSCHMSVQCRSRLILTLLLTATSTSTKLLKQLKQQDIQC
eukprot:TRINITY_DN4220_c1_g2_i1.p1 TRINITY_DN4220_c1_g2~~TRINITY_DN4220_c1_g2_i1.p1  ORF type:complete len:200 (-),score=-4.46 TRINITY_DN4220_c1_g2_i1:783-1382(-)